MAEFVTIVDVDFPYVGIAGHDDGYFCKFADKLKIGATYFVEVVHAKTTWDEQAITHLYATPDGVKLPKEKRMTETIEVAAVGPYGVKVGAEWYKFGKGIDGASFKKGTAYSVATNPGPKGGKYINKLFGSAGSAPAALDPAINANTPPANSTADLKAALDLAGVPRRSKQGDPLTPYDLETQLRISRAGVIQAAAGCQVLNQLVTDGNPATLKAAIRDLAQDMLDWVNNKESKTEATNEAGA
jgi:hypothetical protein